MKHVPGGYEPLPCDDASALDRFLETTSQLTKQQEILNSAGQFLIGEENYTRYDTRLSDVIEGQVATVNQFLMGLMQRVQRGIVVSNSAGLVLPMMGIGYDAKSHAYQAMLLPDQAGPPTQVDLLSSSQLFLSGKD